MGWRDRFKSVHLPEQVKQVKQVKSAVSTEEQVTQVSLVLVECRSQKSADWIDKAEPLPKTVPSEVNDNRLPYPERRALYARQNGLYLRLKRRLDKFERLTSDPETAKTLESWAGDHAVVELYAGQRSWAEHRRIIYTWAKAELAFIRSQRQHNIGGKHNA